MSETAIPTYWDVITRFGEVQTLLPAALWVCLALLRSQATRVLAYRWLFWLALVTLLNAASKLAFIGWGVGVASWNFTGFSGHAMFSAAIYPLLLVTLVARRSPGWHRAALGLGLVLAAGVALSRVMVNAHSVSEVVLGWLLGSGVTLLAMSRPALQSARWHLSVPTLLALWMVLAPDEPTAGMSRSETSQFMALIDTLTRGKTLLMVEHDMSVVFGLATKIAVLVQGQLLAFDSPEVVRTNPLVQQAYLGAVLSSAELTKA